MVLNMSGSPLSKHERMDIKCFIGVRLALFKPKNADILHAAIYCIIKILITYQEDNRSCKFVATANLLPLFSRIFFSLKNKNNHMKFSKLSDHAILNGRSQNQSQICKFHELNYIVKFSVQKKFCTLIFHCN